MAGGVLAGVIGVLGGALLTAGALGMAGTEFALLARAVVGFHLVLAAVEGLVTYQLSSGEKRLVALAGVLAVRPELLLDEPTAGLDDAAAQRVPHALSTLPQAMVVVSHDAAHLSRIANRRVHLDGGRLHGDPAPAPSNPVA